MIQSPINSTTIWGLNFQHMTFWGTVHIQTTTLKKEIEFTLAKDN
jgi:hypothetical protein